ncbi:MAG: hypothetical protein EA401_09905 [Planctomycetota bacterium]|nr:MAG: hypothetical protein EA401_09905 [Planctomycetota bacterium]
MRRWGGMGLYGVVLLLLMAGGAAHAASAPDPVAGPWCIAHADGRVRVVMEFPATVSASSLSHVHLQARESDRDDQLRALPAQRRVQSIQRPLADPGQVLTLILEPQHALYHNIEVWLRPGRSLRVNMPRFPHRASTARFMVMSGGTWPQAEDVEKIQEALGGPLHGAILLPGTWQRQLGYGGWEHQVPLLVPMRRAGADEAAMLAAVGPPGDWRGGIDMGPLALPVIDDPIHTARILSAYEVDWIVPLDTHGRWRLDRHAARQRHHPDALSLMLDSAYRREVVPFIIGAGAGAGFLSDPLLVDESRSVQAGAGGVRYLSAAMDGTAPIFLPREVAVSLDRPAVLAIRANQESLYVRMQPLADATSGPALEFQWQHRPQESMGPAWGIVDVPHLMSQWREEGSEAALSLLAQAALPDLREEGFTSEILRDLQGSSHPAAGHLLRRATAVDAAIVNEWMSGLGEGQAGVRRDVLLRYLAQPARFEQAAFRNFLRTTRDVEVVLSALRVADLHGATSLLEVIRERLALQVDGELPMDADETVQHAIAHALFDSPYLSPTPLRPLAVALEGRVAPLARQPIERFLQRYGRERPADQR